MELTSYVLELLNRTDTIKILGVYDSRGNLDLLPLTVMKAPTPHIILVPQKVEEETQEQLSSAMEEAQPVSILCLKHLRGEEPAYQITCLVTEYQTTGPLYEKFIDELRVSYEGLQGVWILRPLSVTERYFSTPVP